MHPTEFLGYTSYMVVEPYVQPMFFGFIFQNQWLTRNLLVSSLKRSLCLLSLLRESFSYIYKCATLGVAYLCILLSEDRCVALHVWV